MLREKSTMVHTKNDGKRKPYNMEAKKQSSNQARVARFSREINTALVQARSLHGGSGATQCVTTSVQGRPRVSPSNARCCSRCRPCWRQLLLYSQHVSRHRVDTELEIYMCYSPSQAAHHTIVFFFAGIATFARGDRNKRVAARNLKSEVLVCSRPRGVRACCAPSRLSPLTALLRAPTAMSRLRRKKARTGSSGVGSYQMRVAKTPGFV